MYLKLKLDSSIYNKEESIQYCIQRVKSIIWVMTSEKVSSRKLNMYVPDSPMHFDTVARSCWVTILADDSLKYFYFLFLPEKGFLHFI